MFAVLDTNHYVELIEESSLGINLVARATSTNTDLFLSVITVQEVTQGWLAAINRHPAGSGQVNAYHQFLHNVIAFGRISILQFDEAAADTLSELQHLRLRVGTMDLKIAAICIAHDSMLLTRNLVDFEKIPRLRVQNWLD